MAADRLIVDEVERQRLALCPGRVAGGRKGSFLTIVPGAGRHRQYI